MGKTALKGVESWSLSGLGVSTAAVGNRFNKNSDTEQSVHNGTTKGDVMKKLSTVAIAAALVIGSNLSAIQNAQAFSFGNFNMGDSWGDGWGDGWGNRWNNGPRWGSYPGAGNGDPRWGDPGGWLDPRREESRWRNGSGWGNGFSGPRFNFGDGDGFHWGNRSGPRWGNAPRWGAPPPWAYPPYYVAPTPTVPPAKGQSAPTGKVKGQ